MNPQPSESYLRSNLLRVAEILVVIMSVFFTMQYNIKSQGEVLKQLSLKNEQMTNVLNGLVTTVATIQNEQVNMKDDISNNTKTLQDRQRERERERKRGEY